MERSYVECPDIVIANATTNSGTVLYPAFGDAEAFTLFAVAGGDAAKTYKLQVSHDKGNTWFDWTDGTSPIVAPVPGAGAITYGNPVASAFRIVASAAVAANTTWRMQKSVIN